MKRKKKRFYNYDFTNNSYENVLNLSAQFIKFIYSNIKLIYLMLTNAVNRPDVCHPNYSNVN